MSTRTPSTPVTWRVLVENHTQFTYILLVRASFVELPPFQRVRQSYLDDDGFRGLQRALMKNPEAGDVIEGTGGLRKLRHGDARRGKGKSGGLRVIYYWWNDGLQFWLFTLYDKDEARDLSPDEKKALKSLLKKELESRK
jgi:hypothetical protein